MDATPWRPTRVVLFCCATAVLSGLGFTDLQAASVVPPLPPRRPAELQSRSPPAQREPARIEPTAPPAPIAQPSSLPSAVTPEDVGTCERLLAGGKVVAERMQAIAGAEGCGIALPLKLSGILLASGAKVVLDPPATVRCSFAEGLADWIREDLAPLLASKGGGLVRLSGTGGYQCRGRNRVAGAKLSEHATGNAMDIQAFVLADKSVAKITDVPRETPLFAQVKLTACARFATVLGPGSDGYHEDNLHLDLETRRHGRHLCQWQLP